MKIKIEIELDTIEDAEELEALIAVVDKIRSKVQDDYDEDYEE